MKIPNKKTENSFNLTAIGPIAGAVVDTVVILFDASPHPAANHDQAKSDKKDAGETSDRGSDDDGDDPS